MINYIRSFYTTEEDEETVCTILDDDDSRVCHVKSLIKSIAEACVYFSPECESYMNNLEVLVVDDDDDLNAYVTMGSVLVVSSGLLRYYENLQSQGKIANSDEVAVASPLSPAVRRLYFGSRACAHAFQVSLSLSPHLQTSRGIDASLDLDRVPRLHHDGPRPGPDALHQERLRPLDQSRAGARGGLPGAVSAETSGVRSCEAAGDAGDAAGRNDVPRCSL